MMEEQLSLTSTCTNSETSMIPQEHHSSSQQPPLQSFAYFPKLPKELRLLIWEELLPQPRIVQLGDKRWRDHSDNQERITLKFWEPRFHEDTAQIWPPLLQKICHESQDAFTHHYTHISDLQLLANLLDIYPANLAVKFDKPPPKDRDDRSCFVYPPWIDLRWDTLMILNWHLPRYLPLLDFSQVRNLALGFIIRPSWLQRMLAMLKEKFLCVQQLTLVIGGTRNWGGFSAALKQLSRHFLPIDWDFEDFFLARSQFVDKRRTKADASKVFGDSELIKAEYHAGVSQDSENSKSINWKTPSLSIAMDVDLCSLLLCSSCNEYLAWNDLDPDRTWDEDRCKACKEKNKRGEFITEYYFVFYSFQEFSVKVEEDLTLDNRYGGISTLFEL